MLVVQVCSACDWMYQEKNTICPNCGIEREETKTALVMAQAEVDALVTNLVLSVNTISKITGALHLAENVNYGLEWKTIWDENLILCQVMFQLLNVMGKYSDIDIADMQVKEAEDVPQLEE